MSEPAELYACLYAKEFPAQALLRLRPDLHSKPCVVMEGEAPTQHVCSLNTKARLLGLERGMTRVEVDTFPEPVVLARSVQSEAATKAVLLECAGAFSPRVEERTESDAFLCGTRVVLPLRDFTAWIEQNILLSLDKVPFDKNDATLVPEAGSCAECPKRTGFNTLLFGELGNQHDRCSDGACFNNKLNRFVAKQVEAKPKLVQIATTHGTRGDGAVLPRNRYVALQLTNHTKSNQSLSPYQKPCTHMVEAIVVDGAERGYSAKICAEATCAVHFADRRTPDPALLAKEREQRRKELEKRKLEVTIRHRTLAEVLRKVSAPLDRADLALIANTMLEKTEPLRREALARRHKMVDGSTGEVTYPQVQKGLARLLRQLDESGLSKLIVEIVLLGSVESASQEETDVLTTTARRHRVDVAKVRATVVAELAAKQAKAAAKSVTKSTSKAGKAA